MKKIAMIVLAVLLVATLAIGSVAAPDGKNWGDAKLATGMVLDGAKDTAYDGGAHLTMNNPHKSAGGGDTSAEAWIVNDGTYLWAFVAVVDADPYSDAVISKEWSYDNVEFVIDGTNEGVATSTDGMEDLFNFRSYALSKGVKLSDEACQWVDDIDWSYTSAQSSNGYTVEYKIALADILKSSNGTLGVEFQVQNGGVDDEWAGTAPHGIIYTDDCQIEAEGWGNESTTASYGYITVSNEAIGGGEGGGQGGSGSGSNGGSNGGAAQTADTAAVVVAVAALSIAAAVAVKKTCFSK